jgi:hypothetical protein
MSQTKTELAQFFVLLEQFSPKGGMSHFPISLARLDFFLPAVHKNRDIVADAPA